LRTDGGSRSRDDGDGLTFHACLAGSWSAQ